MVLISIDRLEGNRNCHGYIYIRHVLARTVGPLGGHIHTGDTRM